MSDPSPPPEDPGFGPRRLLWLLGVKIVLIAFAVYIALRVYGLA